MSKKQPRSNSALREGQSTKKPAENAYRTATTFSKTAASTRKMSVASTRKVKITKSERTGLPVIHGKVTVTENGVTRRVRNLHELGR